MLNHGITTGALFMTAGAIYERSHSRQIAITWDLAAICRPTWGSGDFLPSALSAFPAPTASWGNCWFFLGAFDIKTWIGLAIVPGVVLAAAYMLRLTQKMSRGAPASPKGWKDFMPREWLYLARGFCALIRLAAGAILNS